MTIRLKINDNLTKDAIYGAQIVQTNNGVEYRNEYLPSGYAIATWGNGQKRNHKQNGLPLLFPGNTYQITLEANFEPSESILLKIILYHGVEQREIIISIKESTVTFPVDYHFDSVQFELVNVSNEFLMFKDIIIQEINEEIV